MADGATIIGQATRVRGRIMGTADSSELQVQGFVEGDVAVGGEVTIDTHGIVGASVQARRIVVRGAVKGDLLGEESILLEDGARVLGDVRAPRVAIAPGALVRGYVETGGSDGATAARARAATKTMSAPSRAIEAPAKKAPPAVHAGSNGGPRRPPPPIVPALKKAKGQIAKKKER